MLILLTNYYPYYRGEEYIESEIEILSKNFDEILVIPTLISKNMKQKYPWYSNKIDFSRLGTIKVVDRPVASRESYNIVSFSAIRKIKNVDKIIDGLSILDQRGIKYHWYHFGTGELFEIMKKKAEDKLDNNKFMGYIANKDLLDWYKTNKPSIFINVSSSEGVPVSIMESMSCGIPTIATDVGVQVNL